MKQKIKKLIENYKNFGMAFTLEFLLLYPLYRITWICDFYKMKKHLKKQKIIKKVNNYKMVLNPSKKGIYKDLLLHGVREPSSTKELQKRLKKGDIILEIGANIGYYALMECSIVGKEGFIWAVEPSSDNYKDLIENIKLNKFKNIKPYRFAFGDKQGKGYLNIFEMGNLNTILKSDSQPIGKEEIEIKRVDDFLKDKKNKPTVIRMDCEGYEYEIIKGMKELLENTPPRMMFIEFHGFFMGLKKSKDLLNKIKKYGYEISSLNVDAKVPNNLFIVGFLMKMIMKNRERRILGKEKITIDDCLKNEVLLKTYPVEMFFERNLK